MLTRSAPLVLLAALAFTPAVRAERIPFDFYYSDPGVFLWVYS